MHGGTLWQRHPGVRSGSDLTFGERAADKLKSGFGSWAFLITLNAIIVAWVSLNVVAAVRHWDPYPFILLNLGLSWLAAQQGGALQIASNRGDRIAAEIALHTQGNTDKIITVQDEVLTLQQQQMLLLGKLSKLDARLARAGQITPQRARRRAALVTAAARHRPTTPRRTR